MTHLYRNISFKNYRSDYLHNTQPRKQETDELSRQENNLPKMSTFVFSSINKNNTAAKKSLENNQIYCILFSSNTFSHYSEREIIREIRYSQVWGN